MSCVTGDETGVVKVWDISKRSAATLKLSFGNQQRTNGVSAMCWRDRSTREVCINRNNGVVEVLDLESKMLSCKKQLGTSAVAACSSAFALVRGKLVIVQTDGTIRLTPIDLTKPQELPAEETAMTTGEAGEPENGEDTGIGKRLNKKKKRSRQAMEEQLQADNDNQLDEEAAAAPIYNDMIDADSSTFLKGQGPIEACHIHRRLALAACGGRENDYCLWDIAGERSEPIFRAKNVRDHVLEVPMPVYVVGASIVSSAVSCIATAYHQVRFYDRRAGQRPVQEFTIDREIERRPTCLSQWNCNKFLIGEASGDVHLYDTRRGFVSRAKLRGGVGSVRQMTKHPSGHQILGVTGLDRKARLFHVPTGKLLQSVYVKQRATSLLLDRHLPLTDDLASFSGVTNTKTPGKTAGLGDDLWNEMDPVVDDFEETATAAPTRASSSCDADTSSSSLQTQSRSSSTKKAAVTKKSGQH